LYFLISEAFEISEKLDPDDDRLVFLSDLRKYLQETNVTDSLSVAQFLLEEASGRGEFSTLIYFLIQ
jgi:hypothetical protein